MFGAPLHEVTGALLPVKAVSGAIARTTGGNVSRYMTAHRAEVACVVLASGESVTSAMLSAGFNTKPNFNREFLRIKAALPSVWPDQPVGLGDVGAASVND